METLFVVDIDGTLIKGSGGSSSLALIDCVRDLYGVEGPINVETVGRTDKAIFAQIIDTYGGTLEELEKAYIQALELYWARSPNPLLPGAREFLRKCQGLGHRLSLGTGNMERAARLKLEYHGLNCFFPVGGFGEVSEDRAEVIRQAIEEAKRYYEQEFSTIWVVGDAPLDIEAAKANGVKAAIVSTGWYTHEQLLEYEPDLLYPDLNALAEVLL
ncbi:MAG: HAD family hydrolase [Limnochordia bacterium]|nr:HAD family hydrolase [Bacillota bacterium]